MQNTINHISTLINGNTIDLSNKRLDSLSNEELKQLAGTIADNQNIDHVILANCSLFELEFSSFCHLLIPILALKQHITSLDLSNNQLLASHDKCKFLAYLAIRNTSLNHLYLFSDEYHQQHTEDTKNIELFSRCGSINISFFRNLASSYVERIAAKDNNSGRNIT